LIDPGTFFRAAFAEILSPPPPGFAPTPVVCANFDVAFAPLSFFPISNGWLEFVRCIGFKPPPTFAIALLLHEENGEKNSGEVIGI
jgi:hypothetical protein